MTKTKSKTQLEPFFPEIKQSYLRKGVIISELDWVGFLGSLEKKRQENFPPNGFKQVKEVLSEDLLTRLKSYRFALNIYRHSDVYLDECNYQRGKAKKEWNRKKPFDTFLRDELALPSTSHVNCFFEVLRDCLVDDDNNRLHWAESEIFKILALYQFWLPQTGRGLLKELSGLTKLKERINSSQMISIPKEAFANLCDFCWEMYNFGDDYEVEVHETMAFNEILAETKAKEKLLNEPNKSKRLAVQRQDYIPQKDFQQIKVDDAILLEISEKWFYDNFETVVVSRDGERLDCVVLYQPSKAKTHGILKGDILSVSRNNLTLMSLRGNIFNTKERWVLTGKTRGDKYKEQKEQPIPCKEISELILKSLNPSERLYDYSQDKHRSPISLDDFEKIVSGDVVKVSVRKPGVAESFWVVVDKKSKAGTESEVHCTVDNNLLQTDSHGLFYGQKLLIKRQNIIQVNE